MNSLEWQKDNKEVIHTYPDLVGLVWSQLHKDFSLEAIDFPEREVVTLDDVFTATYPVINQLIKNDFSSLMRVLYRIDISEKAVQKQMALMPDDTANAISTLMVKREIQKVVLRKQFSEPD